MTTRANPALVTDPTKLPKYEHAAYSAQLFLDKHPEYLCAGRNKDALLKYLDDRGKDITVEHLEEAYEACTKVGLILPPRQFLGLDDPEKVSAEKYKQILKKHGVLKTDERGREFYDEPDEWRQPNIKVTAKAAKWHGLQDSFRETMPAGYEGPESVTKRMFAMMSSQQQAQMLDETAGELPEQLTRK
jgi:hypothetical protein